MLIKILQYIFLGIVQGITEPLPISSSGHLILAKSFFKIDTGSDMNFEVLLHLGSLIAIVIFYWSDIKDLFQKGLGYLWQALLYLFGGKKEPNKEDLPEFKYGVNLIIATIPAAIVGLLFKDKIESMMSSPQIVGFMLLLTAVFLMIANRVRGHKTEKEFKPKNALLTGLMQVVALIPGVSRSGSTTSASLIQGFDIDSSMKFSFMMFIPVALGAILLGFKDVITSPNLLELAIPYLFGIVTSAIVTYVCLKLFQNILKKRRLDLFAYYCFTVGLLAIVLSYTIL